MLVFVMGAICAQRKNIGACFPLLTGWMRSGRFFHMLLLGRKGCLYCRDMQEVQAGSRLPPA